jgi:hypothetical protein
VSWVADSVVLSRNPKIEEAPLQNELMLFDPSSGQFFVLNSTMAFLWKACDGKETLPSIVDRALIQFAGADSDRVRQEFDAAAAELRRLGLLLDIVQ